MEVDRKPENEEGCGSKSNQKTNQMKVPFSTEEFKDTPNSFEDQVFASDREKCLLLFCEEVWLLVFKKMDDPSLLENLSNASLFFRDLLSPQKTHFLFHSAWPVLERSSAKIQSLMNSTLKLRLVCRSWCNAIDNFYQNHPDFYKIHVDETKSANIMNQDPRKRFRLQVDNCTVFNSGKWRSFLEYFYQTHGATDRNPLIGRSLSLQLERNDDDEDVVLARESILGTHGHHIWHCEISLALSDPPSVVYSTLRDILRWMPNLRTLCIETHAYFRKTPIEEAKKHSDNESVSLPTLVHLQLLKTVGVDTFIFAELVRRNSHVTVLDIFRQPMPPQEEQFCLQNLNTLTVKIGSKGEFFTNPRWNSPLVKLYLVCGNCSSFEWQTLYDVLESRYKNTLTFMRIDLPYLKEAVKNKIFATENIYKLDLPHLTHVELKLRNVVCMDFLLPMKDTLTSLDLTLHLPGIQLKLLDASEMEESGASLNSFNCGRRALESNIWNVFPKLKNLHFDYTDSIYSFSRSCSRLEWKEKMMRKL